MLNVFEPKYVLPDRTTFSRHYLPDLYQKEKTKVTEQMAAGLKYFAITMDCWSSRANCSVSADPDINYSDRCYHFIQVNPLIYITV